MSTKTLYNFEDLLEIRPETCIYTFKINDLSLKLKKSNFVFGMANLSRAQNQRKSWHNQEWEVKKPRVIDTYRK
jgi:hypothetical protein